MKYYCDGYTREGNPGTSGGYSIVDEHGILILHEVINKRMTNNETEILGIRKAMDICSIGDQISTDSMNSLSWVRAGKSKSRPDLNPILRECQDLLVDKELNLMWEGRDFNKAGHFNDSFDTGKPRCDSDKPRSLFYAMKRKRQRECI